MLQVLHAPDEFFLCSRCAAVLFLERLDKDGSEAVVAKEFPGLLEALEWEAGWGERRQGPTIGARKHRNP